MQRTAPAKTTTRGHHAEGGGEWQGRYLRTCVQYGLHPRTLQAGYSFEAMTHSLDTGEMELSDSFGSDLVTNSLRRQGLGIGVRETAISITKDGLSTRGRGYQPRLHGISYPIDSLFLVRYKPSKSAKA